MARLWLVVVLALIACGPSTAQVKEAKMARYAAPSATLYKVAIEVAKQDYKIGETDADGARFATEPQIYSPEGGRQSPGAGGFVTMGDRSIMLALVVEVLTADGGNQVVTVTPNTFQMLSGSPKPRELMPDDPNLPGWVHGRVDALAVAIYNAAKQHSVTR
jgi:hypothetical protein